jgi:TRAP-type C4-dicarboxylate transport system substrate-binding protein
MFKKSTVLVLALTLLAGGMLLMAGTAQTKGFQHLSFMGSYVERHPTVVNVWQKQFFPAVEAKFGGKLSFDYFANNTLYPESEGMAALTDGRVDFGTVRPAVFPGKMNLLGVVAIPGMAPNAIVGSLVTQELMDKFPAVRAELPKNAVPYVGWTSASYQIHTLKPVKSLADLKGKKIIVWDATTLEIIKALGGNPIRMTSTDTYLALSKGMGDGVVCPLAPLRSYKISEATKYHLIMDIGVNTFIMMVHKPLWDSMPKDMRDWLTAEGGLKMSLAIGKSLEDGAKADTKWMQDQGHEFFYLGDKERAEFLAAFKPFTDKWMNEECKGMDAAVVKEVLKFTQERAKFHTDQMKAGVYGDYKM